MYNKAEYFKYSRNDSERLMRHLVVDGFLGEELHTTAMDHTAAYVKLGKRAQQLLNGGCKVNSILYSTNFMLYSMFMHTVLHQLYATYNIHAHHTPPTLCYIQCSCIPYSTNFMLHTIFMHTVLHQLYAIFNVHAYRTPPTLCYIQYSCIPYSTNFMLYSMFMHTVLHQLYATYNVCAYRTPPTLCYITMFVCTVLHQFYATYNVRAHHTPPTLCNIQCSCIPYSTNFMLHTMFMDFKA